MAETEKATIGLAEVEISTSLIDGAVGELELLVEGLICDLDTGIAITKGEEKSDRAVSPSRIQELNNRLNDQYYRIKAIHEKVATVKAQFEKKEKG